MSVPPITHCPGTLAPGYAAYSTTCLRRLFNGRKVHHVLQYEAPYRDEDTDALYAENRKRMSISGVQEKYSVLLVKNKIRLIEAGERGTHILKPIAEVSKNRDQLPANEHLTMQIARQIFGIETAENALIFFHSGEPAYITKRFDVKEQGGQWAVEDFASLAGFTPQTHGEHYKYRGHYAALFDLMKKYLPAYPVEAPKLFKRLVFNYLFSNGDAHLKNFSVLETPMGDFRLSPAYDLLNTRMHIEDTDFALDEGLLPRHMVRGKVAAQFRMLAEGAGLRPRQWESVMDTMCSNKDKVARLIGASYLSERAKRQYVQAYQTRWNRLSKS